MLNAIMLNVVILSVASLLKKTTHGDSKLVNLKECVKLILSIVMLSVVILSVAARQLKSGKGGVT